MKTKNLILGSFVICTGYFSVFNYSSYDQQKNSLLKMEEKYRNEIAKDRMEIYKDRSFITKVSSFGAYLAAKEIYNSTESK